MAHNWNEYKWVKLKWNGMKCLQQSTLYGCWLKKKKEFSKGKILNMKRSQFNGLHNSNIRYDEVQCTCQMILVFYLEFLEFFQSKS